MTRIGAAKFKEQCLSLLERLTPEGLIITKRGKPVARLIPYPQKPARLIGCLRERIRIHGDILSTRVPREVQAVPLLTRDRVTQRSNLAPLAR